MGRCGCGQLRSTPSPYRKQPRRFSGTRPRVLIQPLPCIPSSFIARLPNKHKQMHTHKHVCVYICMYIYMFNTYLSTCIHTSIYVCLLSYIARISRRSLSESFAIEEAGDKQRDSACNACIARGNKLRIQGRGPKT